MPCTPITFESLQNACNEYNIPLRVCTEYHWQMKTQHCTINYFPTTKRVFVDGAVKASSAASVEMLLELALGTARGNVSVIRESRKSSKWTKWHRKKLYKTQKTCYWCGEHMKPEEVSLEHKIPLGRGGSNRLDNLTLAHIKCNGNHGNSLPKHNTDDVPWE